jgi:hypothetical protein
MSAEGGTVRLHLLLLPGLVLPACGTMSRSVPHAPPEEAAKVAFPQLDLPREGLRSLEGNMAAAIQLAMADFLPWDARPSPGPVQKAPCLYRRDAYDVTAAPFPGEVMLVRFVVNPAVCDTGETVVDVTTYAVDVRTMRILSSETRVKPRQTG